MKIIFIFSCSGMLRNVPECSAVPCFIDALSCCGAFEERSCLSGPPLKLIIMRKAWFPLLGNFYVRTCVKFTFANKIEAMHEMFARKRKTWTSLDFSFKLSTFYRASILLTWLKFTCFNVRSQTRVSGNQPLGWAVRFQHVNAVRTSLCKRNSLGVKVILVSYKQPLKETTGVGGPKLRINYHLMRYWACLFAEIW